MDKKKTMLLAFWLWVLCVFAAYIIQFRDFIAPVLNALGI
jgi:hypothetical protein